MVFNKKNTELSMKCPVCSQKNPKEAKFCQSCGHSLAGTSSPASPPPQVVIVREKKKKRPMPSWRFSLKHEDTGAQGVGKKRVQSCSRSVRGPQHAEPRIPGRSIGVRRRFISNTMGRTDEAWTPARSPVSGGIRQSLADPAPRATHGQFRTLPTASI